MTHIIWVVKTGIAGFDSFIILKTFWAGPKQKADKHELT